MARIRSTPRIRLRRTLPLMLAGIFLQLQRQCRSRAMRLYLDTMLYRPTGLRVEGMEYGRGSEWMKAMRDGHWDRIYNITGFHKEQFEALLDYLIDEGMTASMDVDADEKLGIFLAVVVKDQSYRYLREQFQHSTRTLHRAFHEILTILRKNLYLQVVRPPVDEVPLRISTSKTDSPFFDECRGAVDGTHIPISIGRNAVKPGEKLPVKSAWRSRKGYCSQNVFACVDFDLNFRFVLAGWEGSAHDARVFRNACFKGFKAPAPNTYFLADGGYSSMDGLLLVPYQKTRYHLSEWDVNGRNPKTPQELFNLRHSSLRMAVERAFGVLKRRFKILRGARFGFSIRTQVFIVYACIALHNWLNGQGADVDAEAKEAEEDGLISEGDLVMEDGWRSGLADDEFRSELAECMWESYQEHREALGL